MRLIDTEKAWKTAQRIYSDPVLLHAIKNVLDSTDTVDAVVLPCKPGTTVYMLHNNTDACLDCPHHVVYFNDEDCTHPENATYYPTIQDSPVCDKQFWEVISYTSTELFLFNHREKFGKTVFLTREEAEAALAKMKGGAFNA
jgi:hypothetical protein